MRPDDGADYIINMGGHISPALLSLVPTFSNVRVRLVEPETQHSDTCTFYRTLLEQAAFVLKSNGVPPATARF